MPRSGSARPARPRRRPPHAPSDPSAAHASAALAATLDPIVTIDRRGIIQSASDSILRLLGWRPDELIGRNISVLMPEPHRSEHDGYLERYARTGQTNIMNRPRRFEALHRSGDLVPVELCVTRAELADGGGPLYVGILRDMSVVAEVERTLHEERLRWQNQLAEQTAALQAAHLRLRMADRMASIGTLAAGLGHDLNNVLLPVRARLNSLRAAAERGEIPRAQREHVEELRKSIAYLQQLADGLHFLARDPEIEEDEPLQRTDIRRWWSEVGSLISRAVPSHVRVRADIAGDVPRISVPPHRLTQAVLNLVINSGEAVPTTRRRGLVRLRARAARRDGGAWACISVTDNGAGMSEEVQRRAFEMFYTTKRRGMGTGLGLPMVRKVVLRAGGSISVRSAPGKGTCISMLLPAAPRSTRAAGVPTARLLLREGRLASMVRHLLPSLGLVEARADFADIWIVDSLSAIHEAPPRANRRRPARVVFLGPAPERVRSIKPGPLVVERPEEISELRRAISAALEGP